MKRNELANLAMSIWLTLPKTTYIRAFSGNMVTPTGIATVHQGNLKTAENSQIL